MRSLRNPRGILGVQKHTFANNVQGSASVKAEIRFSNFAT
jgi:hypothetical protein